MSSSLSVLSRLRWRWLALATGGIAVWVSALFYLRTWWEPVFIARWAIISALVMIYLYGMLWRDLPQNYRKGENILLPTLGLGNTLTLARGVFIAMLAGFLFSPRPEDWQAWLPGILYTAAGIADFLDGAMARILNHATRLGELLDMQFDGVGVLVATLLIVQYGQVPAWFILVGLARYLFLSVLWWRKKLGLPIYDLPPSHTRRALAGIMMGFIFAMLWPFLGPPGTWLAASLWAAPFLGGFFLDGLVVCGLRSLSQDRWGSLRSFLTRSFPVALRLAAGILIVLNTITLLNSYSEIGIPLNSMVGLVAITCLVWVTIILGIAGRTMAVAGLLLLGVQQNFASFSLLQNLLIVLYIAVLFFGSGLLSLWKPEDYFIRNRVGEKKQPAKIALPVNDPQFKVFNSGSS